MNQEAKVQVLAPVGSWESLRAAIQAGADAVYFGIEQLNMRARSSINFTTDDLRDIAEICKEEGVKSCLTLNTILYDHDIKLMQQIIKNIITVFAWEGYYTAILDAPTLFETKVLVPICFPIITVYVENNEMLMDRLKLRSRKSLLAKGNDINEKTLESMIKDINNKIENQYPMEVKKKKSDIAINNNGTEEELYQNFVVFLLSM